VKNSNAENMKSVGSGIAQITSARKSAGELGELQATSRQKTEQIAENSRQTEESSERVRDMALQMEELAQSSYEKATNIVIETNNQKNVSAATVKTFTAVKSIADELLVLSAQK
ncbi:MAG: hypothetical protein NC253_15295, partial [Ruminococcus sp.]|nr:hypothetical protein [Ruminococcus sp.]